MATHHLTTTSNIVFSKSHVVNTKNWHLSNIDMSTPLKLCESSYSECSMIIINVIWKSAHFIITCHSPSSHKISLSDHTKTLDSCAMAQIWKFYYNPSVSTTSSSNQTTLSLWSIYHHAKLTSGLTISDSTWSDQGNDGKNRQWYYSIQRWIRMVRSYNGTKGWCHVKPNMGRSSSLQSQDMDIDMVLFWSEGETHHSLELPRSIS